MTLLTAKAAWDLEVAIREIPEYSTLTDCERNDALNAHHQHWTETYGKLARDEFELVEHAIRAWANSCGVSVEEWAKYYGYRTEREWVEGLSVTVRIGVHPVWLGREPPWPTKPVLLSEQNEESPEPPGDSG